MSANNQILISQHKDRWYVFDNIQAESWDDINKIDVNEAVAGFDSKEDAIHLAHELEDETEYGIGFWLIKDGAKVKITGDYEPKNLEEMKQWLNNYEKKHPIRIKLEQFWYLLSLKFNSIFHVRKKVYTRLKYGISCCKAYSYYYYLSKQIYRELKGYKEIAGNHIMLDHEDFDKELDKMIEAFRLISIQEDDEPKNRKIVKKGLDSFAKNYQRLWY
jgi:hypothetical protein